MITVTKAGGSSVTVYGMTGWDTTQAARSVVHRVIGKPEPDITLRPSASRSGTLRFFCVDLASASALATLHTDSPATMSLDVSYPSLTYVVTGDVQVASDSDDGLTYTVSVAFQEVKP